MPPENVHRVDGTSRKAYHDDNMHLLGPVGHPTEPKEVFTENLPNFIEQKTSFPAFQPAKKDSSAEKVENCELSDGINSEKRMEKEGDETFFVGQPVWVERGQDTHDAIIVSLPSVRSTQSKCRSTRKVKVHWTTFLYQEEVEISRVKPMFEMKNGHTFAPSFSKRKRKLRSKKHLVAQVGLRENPKEENDSTEKSAEKIEQSIDSPNSKSTEKASCLEKVENVRLKDEKTFEKNMGEEGGEVSFYEGQHVWVECGQAIHDATIASLPSARSTPSKYRNPRKVRVQWKTFPYQENVEVSRVKPMFKVKDGHTSASGFSIRKRIKRSLFTFPSPDPRRTCNQSHMRLIDNCATNSAAKKSASKDMKDSETSSGMKFTKIFVSMEGKVELRRLFDGFLKDQLSHKKTKPQQKRGRAEPERAMAERAAKIARRRKKATLEVKNNLSSQVSDCSTAKSRGRHPSVVDDDFNELWNYYMEPVTRENEELPGGMILRERIAMCNLLRFKDSEFRHCLHKKILHLMRAGKRNKVHEMLKDLRKHDLSGQSGDGPDGLVIEILGSKTSDDDAVVVGPSDDGAGNNFGLTDRGLDAPIELSDSEAGVTGFGGMERNATALDNTVDFKVEGISAVNRTSDQNGATSQNEESRSSYLLSTDKDSSCASTVTVKIEEDEQEYQKAYFLALEKIKLETLARIREWQNHNCSSGLCYGLTIEPHKYQSTGCGEASRELVFSNDSRTD